MPPNSRPNEPRIDPIEVRDELLVIQRGLEIRDPNVIVTHRIRATAETPVEFQVVDPLPASLDVDETGFDPNHEPLHGRIDDQAATMSGVVEPGEERVIRYGLRPSEPREPADIERRQQSARPSVAIASAVESDGDADLEQATMTRSASQAGPTDAGPAAGDSSGEAESGREEEPDEPAPTSASGVERISADGPPADDEPSPSTDRDESPDENGMIYPGRGDKADDADRADRASEAPAADEASGDQTGGRTEPTTADAEPAGEPARGASGPDDTRETTAESATSTTADRAERREAGVFGVDEGAPPEDEPAPAERSTTTEAPPEGDVAEALLQGLERGDLSPDQRQRLAEQLDDVLAVTGRPSKSTELRLQELESRVQAMSTYAEALEGIIDEFGPADEFLAEIRREVDGLDTAVEQVQDDLERAATARAALGDRLDNFADEFALMESRLERMDDRVEALRSVQHRKVSTLEAEVEELGDLADRVADLEPELEALREAVQEGRARRRAIARALSEDESPTE